MNRKRAEDHVEEARIEARHRHHMLLDEIGPAGQERLSGSVVTIVGVGALGTAAADRLARAGVGSLRLIDDDIVTLGNLDRQLLFDESQAKSEMSKVFAASENLARVASNVHVDAHRVRVTGENAATVLSGSDLIIDGTDSLESRLVLNDFCQDARVPWIYGSVGTIGGATTGTLTPDTPCLRCIEHVLHSWAKHFGDAPIGLLNTIPFIVGAFQATEAIRHLVHGTPPSPTARMTVINCWAPAIENFEFERRADCRCARR